MPNRILDNPGYKTIVEVIWWLFHAVGAYLIVDYFKFRFKPPYVDWETFGGYKVDDTNKCRNCKIMLEKDIKSIKEIEQKLEAKLEDNTKATNLMAVNVGKLEVAVQSLKETISLLPSVSP
jgi:hypothetical protein